MEITFESLTISWVFSVTYMLFCIYKPRPARIFVGIFYLIMGLGINMVLVFVFPEAFVMIGKQPLLGVYRPIFDTLVPMAPAAWGLFIALFEATMGLMILTKGVTAKLGLIGFTVFCVAITPLNWMAFPAWCLAVGHIHILRSGVCEKSLPELLRRVA